MINKIITACFFSLSCFAAAAVSEKPEEYYPMPIRWDTIAPDEINLRGKIYSIPAGSHGVVEQKGDRLIFKDGTPARFWGTGFATSIPGFPPDDKKEADILAKKLASFGINHVRLIVSHSSSPNIWSKFFTSGSMESQEMDALDYFISALRENGIYYSFCLNPNAGPQFKKAGGIPDNGHIADNFRHKGIQLFDKKAIQVICEWFRAFMAHVNPYTGIAYASDPALIYLDAVNEDSIHMAYFRENWKDAGRKFWFLSDENIAYLTREFNAFLKKKYRNTLELHNAWQESGKNGLDEQEHLEDSSVILISKQDLAGTGKERVRDTMRFLLFIDTDFARHIREILDSLKYRGLFTFSNNWYGHGYLNACLLSGNYTETHGYFDHFKYEKLGEKKLQIFENFSYLSGRVRDGQNNPTDQLLIESEAENPFFRCMVNSLYNRPLIVSEWNHGAFSDYVYEGLIMFPVYSMFQGYSILDNHIYFPPSTKNVRESHTITGNDMHGNMVLFALSPSLSLAFSRGYISEPATNFFIVHAKNENAYLDFAAKNGINLDFGSSDYPLRLGFIHKIRQVLYDEKIQSALPEKITGKKFVSDTDEIIWDFNDPAKAVLTVNASCVQMAAGCLNTAEVKLKNISLSKFNTHGAVTAVCLDNIPLGSSKKILVTAASSYKNTDMIFEYRDNKKIILETGKEPVLMKRLYGIIRFRTKLNSDFEIIAVMPDGSKKEVKNIINKKNQEYMEITWTIGLDDTPWYIIKFL
ncbi:MAG: hypothetical protein A2096_04680 [Spirochaetes bacterium GWF1_41_5]|nr:MAG: hypothetical protein A2096_04680 [Spirochaetes bacterium GWF1_41_5]HBE02250.1 hypothetical protein [Spirochaetia bacterium]